MIIEGNHLIPGFIDNKNVTSTFLLYIKDDKKHRRMVDGRTHAKRNVTEDEFKRTREIQYSLMNLAEKNNITLIDGSQDISKIVDEIIRMIK